MRFALDDDTLALRDGVAAYLAKACPPEAVTEAFAAGGPPAGLWDGLADLGVLGLLAPADAGGLGAGQLAAAAVLAELGRVAAPVPAAETTAVAVPLLVAAGDPAGILAGVVDGSVRVAVASPAGAPGASGAEWFVVDGALHHRSAVSLRPLESVDRTRDLAAVVPAGPGTTLVPVGRGPAGTGAPDLGVVDLGALAAAAVLVGLGRGMLDQTVAYVKERTQFGVPIGSFQAVKHRLADALLGLELAAPAVWAAAHGVDTGAADAARSISLAKALSSDAASATARTALQAHGAMGYTDDHHLHLWLKRTWCLAADHGTAAWHRARIAGSLGLVPAPTLGDHPLAAPSEGAPHA